MMEGALDAAVSERSLSQPAITQHLLGTDRSALVCPQDWPAPPRDPLRGTADLGFFLDHPFITYETGQTVRDRALEYLTRVMQAPPHIARSASDSTSVTQLI